MAPLKCEIQYPQICKTILETMIDFIINILFLRTVLTLGYQQMQFCIIYLTSNIWCLHTWPMWDLTRFFHHFLTTPPTSMVLSRNVKLLSGKEKMKRKRNSRRKRRHHSQTSCPCSFIFMDSDELGLVRQWLIPGSVGRSLPLVGTWFVVFLSATMSFQGMVHKVPFTVFGGSKSRRE